MSGSRRSCAEILSNQRLQIMKLWNDTSMPPASRVGATRVISTQTGDRIRAMLTDEQKAKYNQPRKPHDAAADPERAQRRGLDEGHRRELSPVMRLKPPGARWRYTDTVLGQHG